MAIFSFSLERELAEPVGGGATISGNLKFMFTVSDLTCGHWPGFMCVMGPAYRSFFPGLFDLTRILIPFIEPALRLVS